MPFSLILDILIAVLLVASIAYSVSLNRRLSALRQDRDELAKLTGQFAEATEKAEASILMLKGSTDEIASALNEEISKAEAMRDDLSFLVDRGSSIADRLEGGVRQARENAPSGSPFDDPLPLGGEPLREGRKSQMGGAKKPLARVADPADEGPDARAKAQQELLKALQSMS